MGWKPSQDYIHLVNELAQTRGELVVEEKYIWKVLNKFKDGKLHVKCYPMGAPSPKEVYNHAVELMKK